MNGNAIPTKSRALVRQRDRDRCQRCGAPGSDWHHRKRRREGGHGAENGVTLCRTCHGRDVHAQPQRARREGFIISAHVPTEHIDKVPVRTYAGWALLHPDGTMTAVQNEHDDAEAWFYANTPDA